jgi:hypothetical protein
MLRLLDSALSLRACTGQGTRIRKKNLDLEPLSCIICVFFENLGPFWIRLTVESVRAARRGMARLASSRCPLYVLPHFLEGFGRFVFCCFGIK